MAIRMSELDNPHAIAVFCVDPKDRLADILMRLVLSSQNKCGENVFSVLCVCSSAMGYNASQK
jgi:hypothetical protein